MDILKEILKEIPNAQELISDSGYEGANIVLYTKKKDFFLDNKGIIKECVNSFKKRIELRPDPKITTDQEFAQQKIMEILPDESKADKIIFDPQRSQVIIETEKPGVAIGKQGEFLKKIKEETVWVPVVRRTPAIRSKLIEEIREVLYQNSDYRRKFLDRVGHRIYDGWLRGKKEGWVRISQLGAGRQVGRSCILLQTNESRVLLDCGVDPANMKENTYPYLEAPEMDIGQIDAIVVSHAHADHCALIPYLFKFGYNGPVYCTAPTRDIMILQAIDYMKIQKGEGNDPLYELDHIREMVKHTITLDYEEVSDITPDVRITLYNAGHILGSSMVHLHIGNGLHNFLYTADIKYSKSLLLDPAVTKFPRVESMLLEATMGGKDCIYETREESEAKFAENVVRVINNGGKILVPVLGVGRSQELMLIVEKLVSEKKIPKIPVYVDGVVWDITAIHTAYPEFMSKRVRQSIFKRDQSPFLSDIFKRVGSKKERQQIIDEGGPCVILATSGMLVGGPSVQYLQGLMENPKNMLVFVSYQGEGSLGKRLQRGEKEIAFGREVNTMKMEMLTINGFSGHANRKELMDFVTKCNPRPRKIMVNHGETSRCLDLASSLHKQFKVETSAPKNLEVTRLR